MRSFLLTSLWCSESLLWPLTPDLHQNNQKAIFLESYRDLTTEVLSLGRLRDSQLDRSWYLVDASWYYKYLTSWHSTALRRVVGYGIQVGSARLRLGHLVYYCIIVIIIWGNFISSLQKMQLPAPSESGPALLELKQNDQSTTLELRRGFILPTCVI